MFVSNTINCNPVLQRKVQHIECGVPLSGDIPWEVFDRHLQLHQHCDPCWQQLGARVDDFEGQFANLQQPTMQSEDVII
jgi:hypothetical protein